MCIHQGYYTEDLVYFMTDISNLLTMGVLPSTLMSGPAALQRPFGVLCARQVCGSIWVGSHRCLSLIPIVAT